jgi:hypothetical protein
MNTKDTMSYHDRKPTSYHSPLDSKGISVVNPLHEQRKKLLQLEEFLKEIAEETDDPTLKQKINNVLK